MINLYDIKDPSFLKQMNIKELTELACNIRKFLIDSISATGGHLASNLGSLEATIAMHYVFDSPNDKLLFDVGHQSYVHKILTGRAKDFESLRKLDGLSGYINKNESTHDIWESGHAGTTISAQAGLIAAQKYTKDSGRVIAFIGDASIASGVAFEGLNFLGQDQSKTPIIILNDNKMGISKSVGALNKFLSKIRGGKAMRSTHDFLIKIFPAFLTNFFHKVKRGIKGFIQKDNIFEDLGFDYYGPYEGNDIKILIKIYEKVKRSKKPAIIHIITRKGQGYEPAVSNMPLFHGVESFDSNTGNINKSDSLKSFSEIMALELVRLREKYQFSLICPAMIDAAKLNCFKEKYPNDTYDVGIAEAHAAVMAAGMSLGNVRVVVPYYSTFAQRAFDHMLNDICRQNLPVIFLLDRAGVVGKDGSTHQGIYDIAMLNLMPNIKVAMGKDAEESKGLLEYALKDNSPIAIRYPRAKAEDLEPKLITNMDWQIELEGNLGYVISYGPDLLRIKRIILENKLDVTLVNARFIKPYDVKMLSSIGLSKKPVLVYEQVVESASLGMNIVSYFAKEGFDATKVLRMSFNNDDIVRHGQIESVLERYHLGDSDILDWIKKLCV